MPGSRRVKTSRHSRFQHLGVINQRIRWNITCETTRELHAGGADMASADEMEEAR